MEVARASSLLARLRISPAVSVTGLGFSVVLSSAMESASTGSVVRVVVGVSSTGGGPPLQVQRRADATPSPGGSVAPKKYGPRVRAAAQVQNPRESAGRSQR